MSDFGSATTSLEFAVRQAFAPGGALSQSVDYFAARQGQLDMALAIAHAIENKQPLVVEAGTGVGKTFSYLVPALLSGERVLLSTATKTLQDQLFERDLPRLIQALGIPVRTALLKGRGSYLCLHRLELAAQQAVPAPGFDVIEPATTDRQIARALDKVLRWSKVTHTGDLAEMPGLDERSAWIPLITSTRENCLGTPCPQFKSCHVHAARREALASDVVVINHHLFFADLAVRESGMAELLPTVKVAVFDEAHQLNETGVQFLGLQLSTGQLMEAARDLLVAGRQYAPGSADWQALAAQIEHAVRELRLTTADMAPGAKQRWTQPQPEGVSQADWGVALNALAQACTHAALSLRAVQETAPELARLHERIHALAEHIQIFIHPCAAGSVRWLEVGAQLRLVQSPLDIAQVVRAKLLGMGNVQHDQTQVAAAGQAQQHERAWIFTSATLGDDPQLSWFTEPCGLTQAQVLRVGSPFDYQQQAALYLPHYMSKPQDPGHSLQVAQLAAAAALLLGGRTLVLTTTLRALRTIGQQLKQQFAGATKLEVLIQGQGSKRSLMERLREGSGSGRPGCILVASASFWEGIDIPGEALQLVVIDKLPFPPPGDPLVQARSERLQSQGRNPFSDYFVPEAAVALKQGAGRLIRSETDRGILVVCDVRLSQMSYGRRLLSALPPMRHLTSEHEFEQALRALTRASTTGL